MIIKKIYKICNKLTFFFCKYYRKVERSTLVPDGIYIEATLYYFEYVSL